MKKVRIILLGLLCSMCYTFSNAQVPTIHGSWSVQKVQQTEWKSSGEAVEKEYTNIAAMVGVVPTVYSVLIVSDVELYCQTAGQQETRKIESFTLDNSGILTIRDGKTVEYAYYLPDYNTLIVNSKTSSVSNGEDLDIEQTVSYTRYTGE